MTDYIKGEVLSIIDGDTFDMRVDYLGDDNNYEYNRIERVRVAGMNAAELNTSAGKRAKAELENALLGKTVECSVQARDDYSRVVAVVKVV